LAASDDCDGKLVPARSKRLQTLPPPRYRTHQVRLHIVTDISLTNPTNIHIFLQSNMSLHPGHKAKNKIVEHKPEKLTRGKLSQVPFSHHPPTPTPMFLVKMEVQLNSASPFAPQPLTNLHILHSFIHLSILHSSCIHSLPLALHIHITSVIH
jgi:hypothetical protein